jgi:WD40 repeat protein
MKIQPIVVIASFQSSEVLMTISTVLGLAHLGTFRIDKASTQVSVNGVHISPDQTKFAAIRSLNNQTSWQIVVWDFNVWNFATQKGVEIATGTTSGFGDKAVNSITFSADARLIAIASSLRHEFPGISIWDATTPSRFPVQPLSIEEGFLVVANHPTKMQFATIGLSGKIQFWNDPDKPHFLRASRQWEAHKGAAYAMVYSSDGKWLCSGGADGFVKLWDSQSGSLIYTYSKHDREIRSVAFSPDSETLVTGSDQRIKIWDTFSGELRYSFFGHADWVRGLAITSDNQFLISAGDRKIKIWDLATGKKVSAIVAHDDAIRSIALNGDLLVSGSADGTVKVWQLQ